MKNECNCPKCRADRGETVMSVEEAAAKLQPVMDNLATVAEALIKVLQEINGPKATPQKIGEDFAHGYMTTLYNLAEASMKPGAPPLAKFEYFRHLAMAGINSNIKAEKESDDLAAVTDMPEGVRAVMEALGVDMNNVRVLRF